MFVEGSRKCGAVDLQLRDKVAVIGGASKGLGRACAEVLAQEGVKVTLCSRSASDLEKAAKEIRDATGADVLAFPGDLDRHDTVRDLIAATVGRFGRIDIMVNNSGGPPLARAHDATEEQWAIAVQRSLLFFARMSREALPHLRRQGGGRIINILAKIGRDTSELQSRLHLVCRLLLEKKKKTRGHRVHDNRAKPKVKKLGQHQHRA